MVEHQPALIRLDRRGTGADLRRLPIFNGAHNKAVFAPISEVLRAADKDIAVRCMSPVARANEQKILAVYLAREEHAVAGDGIAGILKLSPALKVLRKGYADSCAVRGQIDPGQIIFPVYFAQARVVAVEDIFILKRPIHGIVAEPDDKLLGARISALKTPAKPEPKGTTAELKMLFAICKLSRVITGLPL